MARVPLPVERAAKLRVGEQPVPVQIRRVRARREPEDVLRRDELRERTGHRAPILRPRHQTPPEFVEGHLPVLTGDVVKKRLDLPSPRAKHLLDVHHRHRPLSRGRRRPSIPRHRRANRFPARPRIPFEILRRVRPPSREVTPIERDVLERRRGFHERH